MNIPHGAQLDDTGHDVAEREWVLFEFVSIAILLSVRSGIQTGTQYVNPPMDGLTLTQIAVNWMSFGEWARPTQDTNMRMSRPVFPRSLRRPKPKRHWLV